jgi:hypothetical protein
MTPPPSRWGTPRRARGRRVSATGRTGASRRERDSRTVKACGRQSGCCPPTPCTADGRPVARSTSWRRSTPARTTISRTGRCYGAPWPDNASSGTSTTPPGNVWESFFTYAIEWEAGEIRWFVDDVHYATQTDWYSEKNPFRAPFDQRFHLLLNVAVGGNWPGPPDGQTAFPQEMVVDYVRVCECSLDPTTGHGCGTSDSSVTPL